MLIPCKNCISLAICKTQFNEWRKSKLFLQQKGANEYAVYKLYGKCSRLRPIGSIPLGSYLYNKSIFETFTGEKYDTPM